MAFHHVVKFLINLLVFLLSTWSENIRGIGIGALAASVLLLVQGLYMKTNTGGSTEQMKYIYEELFENICGHRIIRNVSNVKSFPVLFSSHRKRGEGGGGCYGRGEERNY